MNVHRFAAVAALPCLCLLASQAAAQDRRNATFRPIAFQLTTPSQSADSNQRVQLLEERTAPHSGMLESLPVAGNAEIGVGRFGVGPIARQRSHMERDRMMGHENRSVAGAGMRVRF